jgi:hypothetical protein
MTLSLNLTNGTMSGSWRNDAGGQGTITLTIGGCPTPADTPPAVREPYKPVTEKAQ